jgi:hypothetical protein
VAWFVSDRFPRLHHIEEPRLSSPTGQTILQERSYIDYRAFTMRDNPRLERLPHLRRRLQQSADGDGIDDVARRGRGPEWLTPNFIDAQSHHAGRSTAMNPPIYA